MKRILTILFCFLLCASLSLPALAAGASMASLPASGSEIPIWTAEDMLKIAEKPDATYRLMRDIDMSGVEWNSPAFSGVLHGNGKALLNLTVTQPGEAVFSPLNASEKPVECVGAGLFSRMEGARVDFLTLLGLNVDVQTDKPVFVGGIAGGATESAVENCEVVGRVAVKSTSDFYGAGGVVGYGSATVNQCIVSAQVMCLDGDLETADTAYLGGLLGYGFLVCRGSQVELDGYIGAKGKTYSGGIVGVLMQYSLMREGKAEITNTIVNGELVCMENSQNSRVEADRTVGKINKTWNYAIDAITGSLKPRFIRNEPTLPSPEACENPQYFEDDLVDADCYEFGYSKFVCKTCGYSYKSDYTLKDHAVTDWAEMKDVPGMMTGKCGVCEETVYELRENLPELEEPEIPEIPTTYPQVELQPEEMPVESGHDFTYILAWVFLASGVGILIGLAVYVLKNLRKS